MGQADGDPCRSRERHIDDARFPGGADHDGASDRGAVGLARRGANGKRGASSGRDHDHRPVHRLCRHSVRSAGPGNVPAGAPGAGPGAAKSCASQGLTRRDGAGLITPPAMSPTPASEAAQAPNSPAAQAQRRRTFAIISHPDAGKTTLTEHLLLLGGAIHAAGRVKARGEARRAKSDWMKIEQERGISVTSAVMTFEYQDAVFNLLDTPGHEDFSEDTYRTLTAADSAVMVIDAAKGIEAQTRKLFEVCRLRDIPIMTFVNKMDREARDPFELLDEISDQLQIETAPMMWPAGMGLNFKGVLDFTTNDFVPFSSNERVDHATLSKVLS